MSDDVTIARDAAWLREYAGLDKHHEGARKRLLSIAEALDPTPPPTTLREAVLKAGQQRFSVFDFADADAVLTVVRERIEALPAAETTCGTGFDGCFVGPYRDRILALFDEATS